MGLFSNFFRKKEHIKKPKKGNEFDFLMVDWFSDAKLSYNRFKEEFYPKALELFLQINYIKEGLEKNPEKKAYLDMDIAFFYLIYHHPDYELIHRLYDLLYDEKNRFTRPNYLNTTFGNALKQYPEIQSVFESVHIIWHVFIRKINNNYIFDELYKINQLKYSDTKSFIRVFNFITKLDFENRLVNLLKIYLQFHVDYKTQKLKLPDDYVQQTIRKTLQDEIEHFNIANPHFQFDLDFYERFYRIYYYKENFELWHKTDYKERHKLTPQDFEELQEFIRHNDLKKILKHFIFSYSHSGIRNDKYDKAFIQQLLGLIDADESFLNELLLIIDTYYSSYSSIIIDEVILVMADKLPISYHSNTRKNLEEVLMKRIGYYSKPKASYLKLLNKIAGTIPDLTEKEVVKGKYTGYLGQINLMYNTHYCEPGEKMTTLKKVLKKVSQVTQLSVLKIVNEYATDGPEIKINHQGITKTINFNQINEILQADKTGYQFVPVPIKKEVYFHPPHFSYLLCGCEFLNSKQFDYLINHYVPENFAYVNIDEVYANISFNKNNPLNFDDYVKQLRKSTNTENKFLSDNNWKWFKESYIDTLPNPEKWYKVMDLIVSYPGSKKPNKKWMKSIQEAISEIDEKTYFNELRTLINQSINEDFWYYEDNRNALKGLAWSCTVSENATGLMILKQIIEKAYTKVPNIGPRSIAIGNAALEALINHPNPDSFGILNLLKNQTKYTRFSKVLDKYINRFIENSDEDEESLADKAIPDFDFKNGQKIVPYDNFSVKYEIKYKKLTKKWIVNNKAFKTTPAFIKEQHPKLLKEIAAEFKSINAFLKTTKTRIPSYWKNNRKWPFEYWNKYIKQKEMLNPWLQGLIWKNETQNNSFILLDNELYDLKMNKIQPGKEDIISLWHPISSDEKNILEWQKFVVENKIEQTERQAFREHYPFSEKELKMDNTSRFNHHFLKVNKLMAIANSVGWIFTYVHEDVNWPRTYLKTLDITAHLQCDYDRNDFAIPTKGFFITKGDTRNISYGKKYEKIPFENIPPMTLSEICRDVDLFIATTSIAHDVKLSTQTELLKNYREDFSTGKFSDNAQAKIRKQIISLIGEQIGLKNFEFDKNYLIITGKWNKYSINLGSGFAQIMETKRHIPLIPDLDSIKKSASKILPVKDDETLYIILAKALFLQNDAEITDSKILKLLKSD